ncbi:MAG: polysulfide reductase NrfD [Deltaproteobacteria bacterium]|nr:polysulfide reductase NrfD [Deltaproteobacteria bacterium]
MQHVEISTTRANPLVDPVLQVWGWEIPVYLFLGGLVAGLLALSGFYLLRSRTASERGAWPQAPMLGVVLLTLGMGALFLDLDHPWYVWRVYLTFEPASPMSWGSWILILVYPALFAAALLHPPERVPFGAGLLAVIRRGSEWMWARPRLVQAIALSNLVGGIALGLYTGILLGTMVARPLWNSAILGPLFLFSGLSSAAALMHVLTLVRTHGLVDSTYADLLLHGLFQLLKPPGRDPSTAGEAMVRADAAFLSVEGALIALFVIGLAASTEVQQQALQLLLTGAYAPVFWCLILGTGILVPLVLQSLELAGRIRHTVVPALLVIAGAFLLRWVLVQAGQVSSWT